MVVRRGLAISLMLIFSLPLVSSLFGTSVAESTVPACCRRDGRHHCGVVDDDATQGSRAHAVRGKCPYAPTAPAARLIPSFAPSTAAAVFAGITRHPTVSPQTDAQLRISFDRACQKRGPPALHI